MFNIVLRSGAKNFIRAINIDIDIDSYRNEKIVYYVVNGNKGILFKENLWYFFKYNIVPFEFWGKYNDSLYKDSKEIPIFSIKFNILDVFSGSKYKYKIKIHMK